MCCVGGCFLMEKVNKKCVHTRTGADQLIYSTVQSDLSMPPIGWLCNVLIGLMDWHSLSLLNHILLHTASQQTSLLRTGLVHKACIYIWILWLSVFHLGIENVRGGGAPVDINKGRLKNSFGVLCPQCPCIYTFTRFIIHIFSSFDIIVGASKKYSPHHIPGWTKVHQYCKTFSKTLIE